MKFVFVLLFILVIGYFSFNYLTTYKSAFEADQQCHYLIRTEFMGDNNFQCDHDLETRQWLLFEDFKNDKASKVIKRFKY